MSPDERQLLTGLFDRVRSAATAPRDAEAEALIYDAVRAQPYAPYLLAQAVIVQEQALKSANDRLQQLDARNKELEARVAQGASSQAAPSSGGFLGGLGSLFGAQPQRAAPQPQRGGPWQQGPQPGYGAGPSYAPPQASPWGNPAAAQPQSGGFLRGALTTAAGVAGGVLVAESLSSMFSGQHNGGGLFGASDTGAGLLGAAQGGLEPIINETVVNNFYGEEPQGAAWNQPTDNSYITDASDGGYFDSGADDTDYA